MNRSFETSFYVRSVERFSRIGGRQYVIFSNDPALDDQCDDLDVRRIFWGVRRFLAADPGCLTSLEHYQTDVKTICNLSRIIQQLNSESSNFAESKDVKENSNPGMLEKADEFRSFLSELSPALAPGSELIFSYPNAEYFALERLLSECGFLIYEYLSPKDILAEYSHADKRDLMLHGTIDPTHYSFEDRCLILAVKKEHRS